MPGIVCAVGVWCFRVCQNTQERTTRFQTHQVGQRDHHECVSWPDVEIIRLHGELCAVREAGKKKKTFNVREMTTMIAISSGRIAEDWPLHWWGAWSAPCSRGGCRSGYSWSGCGGEIAFVWRRTPRRSRRSDQPWSSDSTRLAWKGTWGSLRTLCTTWFSNSFIDCRE